MNAHVAQPVLLNPGAGEGEVANDRPEHNVRILFSHELLDVTWSQFGPREPGADPHVHREHTDSFYVLEGEITFRLGPEREPVRAQAGTFVAVPPNVIHAFDNEADEGARFLNFHAPSGGFADYLRGKTPGFDSADPPEDGGEPASTAIVSPPGGGERLARGKLAHYIKAQLPQLAAMELSFEPGWEVEPHSHADHVDSFFVLDGEVAFLDTTAGPGTFVAAPPKTVHGFKILGDRPSTSILNIHAPDTGFADRMRAFKPTD